MSTRGYMFKHGMINTKIYNVWCLMKSRCNGDPTHKRNEFYSRKGISYDPRWEEFTEFYKDMGESYEKHLKENFDPKRKRSNTTLDRIDNDGNYCKDNCRWATTKQQMRNTSRNRFVEYKGETMCLSAWAEKFGIKKGTLDQRFYCYKWDMEKCLTYNK